MITFISKGVLYEKNEFGVIKQSNPENFVYDAKYSATYDTEAYKRGSETLQAMRYGFATAAHGNPVFSILDCGYGNGDFMKFARQHSKGVWGYDVTGVPVPDSCLTAPNIFQPVDVVSFWDCLEHFHDIDFLAELECQTICISLPYCRFNNIVKEQSFDDAVNWFNEWKHRKPNEHIRHFNRSSLKRTMQHFGWREVSYSHQEDIIRKPIDHYPNILTMAFKKG